MATLLLPIGIPASGKTTWREKVKTELGDTLAVISPDEIRQDVFGVADNPRYEAGVWRIAELQLERCLTQKEWCLLDATNVAKKWRRMPIGVAKSRGATVHGVVFDIHPRYAELRNAQRERSVPRSVIYQFHYTLLDEFPHRREGFDEITRLPQLPTAAECKAMGGRINRRRGVCQLTEEIQISK